MEDATRLIARGNGRARAHLLAQMFSGSGEDERNIIGVFRAVNQVMSKVERKVLTALKSGTAAGVYYRVIPVYEGSSGLPTGVDIQAIAVDAADNVIRVIANLKVVNGRNAPLYGILSD